MNIRRSVMSLAVLAALPGHAPVSYGAESYALEEVIVTARKRMESQQDVPVSITSLSGDDLEKLGIVQFGDLELANPNTQIGYGSSGGGISSVVAMAPSPAHM